MRVEVRDDCETAADVMRRALDVARRRRELKTRPAFVPPPKPMPRPFAPAIFSAASKPQPRYLKPDFGCPRFTGYIVRIKKFAVETDPTVVEIQRAVIAKFGIPMADMLSARRFANITKPRQAAIALCHRLTSRSMPDLGRRFGGRHHTTILHACRVMAPIIARAAERNPKTVNEWAAAMHAVMTNG